MSIAQLQWLISIFLAVVTGTPGLGDAGGTEGLDQPPSAQIQLGELEVKGRAPMTGYEREKFGSPWTDDVDVAGGRNGCDTRNDILGRDLQEPVIREGTRGCLVESGTLVDPYSGEVIDFERGDGQIHIDHVVSLANAWVTGAQFWDERKRENFANDPANLLATTGRLNQQKGAGDAATWMPPRRAGWCEYVSQQIDVKYTYGLWVTPAELEALERGLSYC